MNFVHYRVKDLIGLQSVLNCFKNETICGVEHMLHVVGDLSQNSYEQIYENIDQVILVF